MEEFEKLTGIINEQIDSMEHLPTVADAEKALSELHRVAENSAAL